MRQPSGHCCPVAAGPFSGPLHLRRSKLAKWPLASTVQTTPLRSTSRPRGENPCASRFPLPLVSSTSAVHPCDFSSSPVWSNIFVFSQPTTPPPPPVLVHSVLFASSANTR